MGLFDTLHYYYKEVSLPMPEKPMGYSGSEYFQTKSLECLMEDYQIREDGYLYYKKATYETKKGNLFAKSILDRLPKIKEISCEWIKMTDYNGILEIHNYEYGEDKYDYWISYDLVLFNGKVSAVKLNRFKYSDNSERLTREKHFLEKRIRQIANSERFCYKYIYYPYNRFIRLAFWCINKLIAKISNFLLKIESKLKIKI